MLRGLYAARCLSIERPGSKCQTSYTHLHELRTGSKGGRRGLNDELTYVSCVSSCVTSADCVELPEVASHRS